MSTPSSHPSDAPEGARRSVTHDEAQLSPEENPGKPPRTTASLLAIFALICLGLLFLLLIGEIGVFEIGN